MQESNLKRCRFLLAHFPALFESQPLQVPADLTQALALDIPEDLSSQVEIQYLPFSRIEK